jgi:hypothetical protein
MAYTASPYRTNANPPQSNFGGLVVDGNRIGMTGVLGSSMQSIDGTSIPIASPLTMSGSVQTLTVPSNAVQITINPTTAVVWVSEDSTMSAYFTVPAGTSQTIDIARQKYIYLKGTSPDVVNFYFTLV